MDRTAHNVDTVRILSVTGHQRQDSALVSVLLVIQETIVSQVFKYSIPIYIIYAQILAININIGSDKH